MLLDLMGMCEPRAYLEGECYVQETAKSVTGIKTLKARGWLREVDPQQPP